MSACLLPQSDQLIDDLPPVRNHPPRIVEDTLVPPTRLFSIGNEPSCPPIQFDATVEDADPLDTITSSWWVDGVSYKVRELTLHSSDAGTGALPRGTETISIPSASPGALNAVKTHLVELLISDGQLFERTSKRRVVQLGDGGTIEDETYVVTTSWAVVVENRPCP